MPVFSNAAVVASLLLSCGASLAAAACQTVVPVENLNVEEYTRASWFVQEQQVNGYQPEEDLFCVTATYDLGNTTVPRFDGTVIDVYNYAHRNGQNVDVPNGPGGGLCARALDDNDAARLLVAPCFLPNFAGGDYWVLGAGPSPDRYDWALISGGQPSVELDDGCTTPPDGINGSGLWLFSRLQDISPEDREAAYAAAAAQGVSLQRMLPVPQKGCVYSNAYLKGCRGGSLSNCISLCPVEPPQAFDECILECSEIC